MCTVWHVDKYKITFKLVINSRRTSRGPAVEKHWAIPSNVPAYFAVNFVLFCTGVKKKAWEETEG